jgi:hypothetical protein
MSTLEPSTRNAPFLIPGEDQDAQRSTSETKKSPKLVELMKTEAPARQLPARSPQTGTLVTGPILTAEDRQQLSMLAATLDWGFYAQLGEVAQRARQSGRQIEGLGRSRPEQERPSLRNLRRHAMRQWFDSVLEGREGELYSRRLRSLYFPILAGDAGRDEVPPILIEHFLDYIEGYVTSWLLDEPRENLVPDACLLNAFRKAVDVQRHAIEG